MCVLHAVGNKLWRKSRKNHSFQCEKERKPYNNCNLQYLQRITFITYICIDISNTSCDKCQNALKKIWPLNCPTDYRMIRDVILVSLGGKRRKKVGRLPEKSMNDDITLAKRFWSSLYCDVPAYDGDRQWHDLTRA
jgi:hypothetical protein